MTAARSVAVRMAAYANAYGPDDNPHPGGRSQLISSSSLPSSMSMYQDIDLPSVTARSKQCLKPSQVEQQILSFDVLRSRIRISKLLVKEVPA